MSLTCTFLLLLSTLRSMKLTFWFSLLLTLSSQPAPSLSPHMLATLLSHPHDLHSLWAPDPTPLLSPLTSLHSMHSMGQLSPVFKRLPQPECSSCHLRVLTFQLRINTLIPWVLKSRGEWNMDTPPLRCFFSLTVCYPLTNRITSCYPHPEL